MKLKSILLFLALLLPVSIFLFLHFFGKNEFVVPVFYKEEVALPADCNLDYTFPYKVNSTKLPLSEISVVLFSAGFTSTDLDEALFQLGRLNDEFGDRAPDLFIIKEASDSLSGVQHALTLEKADYKREQECVFLAGTNPIILVDDNKQIRGLYQDVSLKEVDRLILELKIIYKQY
ncbi:MAG TPA: hypothetical protein DIS90_00305 [Cytophagales bacterium]|nr:hypothetical protein [Cytophagales bacterium]HCR54629.1 hypothetical protein [Cytophagales bacterium]